MSSPVGGTSSAEKSSVKTTSAKKTIDSAVKSSPSKSNSPLNSSIPPLKAKEGKDTFTPTSGTSGGTSNGKLENSTGVKSSSSKGSGVTYNSSPSTKKENTKTPVSDLGKKNESGSLLESSSPNVKRLDTKTADTKSKGSVGSLDDRIRDLKANPSKVYDLIQEIDSGKDPQENARRYGDLMGQMSKLDSSKSIPAKPPQPVQDLLDRASKSAKLERSEKAAGDEKAASMRLMKIQEEMEGLQGEKSGDPEKIKALQAEQKKLQLDRAYSQDILDQDQGKFTSAGFNVERSQLQTEQGKIDEQLQSLRRPGTEESSPEAKKRNEEAVDALLEKKKTLDGRIRQLDLNRQKALDAFQTTQADLKKTGESSLPQGGEQELDNKRKALETLKSSKDLGAQVEAKKLAAEIKADQLALTQKNQEGILARYEMDRKERLGPLERDAEGAKKKLSVYQETSGLISKQDEFKRLQTLADEKKLSETERERLPALKAELNQLSLEESRLNESYLKQQLSALQTEQSINAKKIDAQKTQQTKALQAQIDELKDAGVLDGKNNGVRPSSQVPIPPQFSELNRRFQESIQAEDAMSRLEVGGMNYTLNSKATTDQKVAFQKIIQAQKDGNKDLERQDGSFLERQRILMVQQNLADVQTRIPMLENAVKTQGEKGISSPLANVDAKKPLAPEGPLKSILPASQNNQDDSKLIAKSTNSGETSTIPPIKPNTPELSEADIAAFNSQVETAKKWGEMIPDRLKNVFNQAMAGLSGDVSSNPTKAPQGDGGLVGQMIRSTGKAFLESPLNRFIDSAALGVNRNILDPLTKNPEIAAGFAVAASGFLGPTVATLATGVGLFTAGSLVVKGGFNILSGVFNGNSGKVDEGIGDVFSGGIPFLMGRSPKAQSAGQFKGTKAPSLPEIKPLNEPLPSPVSTKVVDPGLREMSLFPTSASRPGSGRTMSGNTGDLKIGPFPGGSRNSEFPPGAPLTENTFSFPPRPGDSSGFNLVNPAPVANPTNRIVLLPTNAPPVSPTVPRLTGLGSEAVESLSVVGSGVGPSASGGINPQILVNPGLRPSGQAFRLPQEVTIPGRVLPGETLPLNPMDLPGGVPGVAPKLSPAVQPMFQPVKPAGKSLAPEDAPNFMPALPPGEIPIKSPLPGGNPGSVKPGESLVNKPVMFPEQPGALKSGNTETNLPGVRPEIKSKPENFPGDFKLPGAIPPASPSLPSKESPLKLPSFPFIQPGDPLSPPSSKESTLNNDSSTLPLPNSPEMMGPKPASPSDRNKEPLDKNLGADKNLSSVWPVLKPKPESPVTQEQLTFGQKHLDNGIELIKSGKYNEAIVHFLNKDAAQKSGASLNSNLILRTLNNQSDLEDIINEASSSSWYTASSRRIMFPQAGMLNEAQNPQMARVLARENAFLALEEFSHHIQNVTGSPISQAGFRHQGPFLNDELDVAQFMKEQGLEPSDRFLSRYSQRSLVANSTAMRPIINGIGLGDDIQVGRRSDLSSAPIFQNDARVSRDHLMMIRVQTGELFAQNLSKNGTQVNGQLLTKPTPLKKGDLVKIGNSFFLIE
jgi:hypothetical protein